MLQSLRACFQYDSVQFVDEDRFRHLLPALVAQLGAFPPQDALLLLAAEEEEDASLGSGTDATAGWRAQDSVYGRAAVDALVDMGVSSGSDALWTPFNHQVPSFGSPMASCISHAMSYPHACCVHGSSPAPRHYLPFLVPSRGKRNRHDCLPASHAQPVLAVA